MLENHWTRAIFRTFECNICKPEIDFSWIFGSPSLYEIKVQMLVYSTKSFCFGKHDPAFVKAKRKFYDTFTQLGVMWMEKYVRLFTGIGFRGASFDTF